METKPKQKITMSDMVSVSKRNDFLLAGTAQDIEKKEVEQKQLLEEVWADAPEETPFKVPVVNLTPEEKKKTLRERLLRKELSSFIVLAIVILVIFQAIHIFAYGLYAKQNVMQLATQGLSNLKEAQSLTQQKNFNGAQDSLEAARKNFLSAQQDLQGMGIFANTILSFTGKGKSAQSIVDAGQAIADAGLNLNNFYAIASQIKPGPGGIVAPDGTYETLNAAQLYLKKVGIDLQRAQTDFANVDPNVLPADIKVKFDQYNQLLQASVSGVNQITDGISLLQSFIGSGKKNFLILFENDNELRATGGFIGTYGYFHLDDGKILDQKISSIYDLDGQLKEFIAPPGPYQIMTNKWALRDSNYFVDFKKSAQKASVFYEKEGMETPDAVIAFTPDVFIDLLKITGPIQLPKYGLVLTSDNFRDQVQVNTSDSGGADKNPKQMLSDFAPILLQKLADLPEGSRKDLIPVILNNLAKKNILMYDRNPQVQNQIEAYNWGGTIADTDRDYLAIYNTNVGGKKTDVHVKQTLNVQSEVQSDGSIINTLTYSREHDLNPSESDPNIDYIRFLVPYGSQLLSAKGFNPKPFRKSDASQLEINGIKYSVDSDLQIMDQNTRIDATSSTVITQEAGKTVFANWVETAPGDTSVVVIKYRLPFNASDSRKYSFTLQKQPGNNPIDYDWQFIPNYPILWYTPLDLRVENNRAELTGTLQSDLFIGAVLDNQK